MSEPDSTASAGASLSEPRTWAEIDLGAISSNILALREWVGPGPEFLAAIKANAYGHGAVPVASAIAGHVEYFGVACVEEAVEIAGLGPDIILLSPCLPPERKVAFGEGMIATVSSAAEASAYASHGSGRVNFKIDTGMGRIGCWMDEAVSELKELIRIPGITVHSISTHLPSADDDPEFTRDQLGAFGRLKHEFRKLAPAAKFHSLNSVGIFGFPEFAGDIVRAGLAIYGCVYSEAHHHLLRPAMTWKARLMTVRDVGPGRSISYGRTFVTPSPMRIGSVSVGYADGFPRQVSGAGACVLVGGHRCPVLGRVTMDQIVVDLANARSATEGDEVVLLGRQGTGEITARTLADQAGTIAWDIFTGLSGRVRRIYC